MNFIMNLQTFIKQWNQYLKISQMPNFDVTTHMWEELHVLVKHK